MKNKNTCETAKQEDQCIRLHFTEIYTTLAEVPYYIFHLYIFLLFYQITLIRTNRIFGMNHMFAVSLSTNRMQIRV